MNDVEEYALAGRDGGVGFWIITFWVVFFFQAEDGIRDTSVTGVQTCALPIWGQHAQVSARASTSLRHYPSLHRVVGSSYSAGSDLRIAVSPRTAFRAGIDGTHVSEDRKSTRLNSSHRCISYAVFCLKKKK